MNANNEMDVYFLYFFFSSRRRHTRCALVTGVQTCALPVTAKPTHVKRVAELLHTGEFETPEAAAKAALNLYDELLDMEQTYAVVHWHGKDLYLGVKGFPTRKQALLAIHRGKAGAPGLRSCIPELRGRSAIGTA